MAKNYTIATNDGLTVVRFGTSPSKEEILEAVDFIEHNSPTKLRLYDLTLGGLTLSIDELREVAAYGKSRSFPPSKAAIVAPDDLSFGLARLFGAHREDEISEHKVFRTEKEALGWVGKA